MKTTKATGAEEIVDKLNHHNLHSKQLLSLYPDLQIVYDGAHMDYYSIQANPQMELLQFVKDPIATYVNMYVVLPYKELQLSCPQCDGKMRVNSVPSKIPFLFEHEHSFNSDYSWYGTVYEETFKLNNFSQVCLSGTQLYVFNKLEEYRKNNRKVDVYYLPNSIKKLLPFT